ncbi:hypothetical protein [Streptomyces sp. VRA16 Mangrove soil]|uniref:hypothetical protein n=1 Tax=Streptomyces sp. VRA16 Mangrove soil TaxID=2817434 RepID=UPI001A9DDE1D|nr:hypothetical protein [Streptomyces sp. VRA16 Mangrove soil]MBO1330376.1 hypothetical protein [Streptomyces sp. VRA16 Mangrove soil]
MLGIIGTLWVVGLVLLAAAIIGQSISLGGTEVPALTQPKLRWAVAAIGVFALILGALLYGQSLSAAGGSPRGGGAVTVPPTASAQPSPSPPPASTSSRPPSPTTAPPEPSRSDDTTEPPSEAPRTPGPAAPAVKVRWHGALLLRSTGEPTGWWLDQVPPTYAVIGDLGLECDCHAGEVVANAIASWEGARPPTYQQCAELSGRLARRALAVRKGTTACLRTWEGRLGYVTFTSVPGPYEFNVEATVWDQE